MAFDVDFFVIGAGSGGVRAARIAAGHGAKTLVAEESRIGACSGSSSPSVGTTSSVKP